MPRRDLFPAERVSLCWTHNRACEFPAHGSSVCVSIWNRHFRSGQTCLPILHRARKLFALCLAFQTSSIQSFSTCALRCPFCDGAERRLCPDSLPVARFAPQALPRFSTNTRLSDFFSETRPATWVYPCRLISVIHSNSEKISRVPDETLSCMPRSRTPVVL